MKASLSSYTFDVKLGTNGDDRLIVSCQVCRQFTEHDLHSIVLGTKLRCAPKRPLLMCPQVVVIDDALLALIRTKEALRHAERAVSFFPHA